MKILIDENLPEDVSNWQSDGFMHAKSLGDKISDSDIWRYARANDLIIVSKDSDFSNRILTSEPPPRVIHMRIGKRGILPEVDSASHNKCSLHSKAAA
jgi:predicted nuclease of predicted toxin-antitoxin system